MRLPNRRIVHIVFILVALVPERIRAEEGGAEDEDGRLSTHTVETVAAHYEALPYPPRDPEQERTRLTKVFLAEPLELSHYIYGGRLERLFTGIIARQEKFRVLVAGGGTGDVTVYMAQRLSSMNMPYEIVHVDLSQASIDVAVKRLEVRQLQGVQFIRGSLLDVGTMGIGHFDFINSCGVLHHLDDPAAGLRALTSVLKPDGGMGIMVYGELGRTGVYHIQEMAKKLFPTSMPVRQRIRGLRALVKQLPETNWFFRNPDMINCGDMTDYGDEGIYDLLLHSCDKPFQVDGIMRWAAGAGLRVTDFFQPAVYEPATYLRDEDLLASFNALPMFERYHAGELLTGHVKKHTFYLTHANSSVTPPVFHADAILCRHIFFSRDVENLPKPPKQIDEATIAYNISTTVQMKPLQFSFPMLSHYIIKYADCERSIREIYARTAQDMKADGYPSLQTHNERGRGEVRKRKAKKPKKGAVQEESNLAWDVFWTQAAELYRLLNGLGWAVLTVKGE